MNRSLATRVCIPVAFCLRPVMPSCQPPRCPICQGDAGPHAARHCHARARAHPHQEFPRAGSATDAPGVTGQTNRRGTHLGHTIPSMSCATGGASPAPDNRPGVAAHTQALGSAVRYSMHGMRCSALRTCLLTRHPLTQSDVNCESSVSRAAPCVVTEVPARFREVRPVIRAR